jgi:hypothetical protein
MFVAALAVFTGYVGDEIRNHASSAQCSVGKYGRKLQTAIGANGDDTRNLHGSQGRLSPEVVNIFGAAARYRRETVDSSHDDSCPDNSVPG